MDSGTLTGYDKDAMTAEDTNIRSILLVSSFRGNPLIPRSQVVETLPSFCGYCDVVRPSIEIAARTLALACSLGNQGCSPRHCTSQVRLLGEWTTWNLLSDLSQKILNNPLFLTCEDTLLNVGSSCVLQNPDCL